MASLLAESKRERIQAAARQWPQLSPAAIAVIAAASPSYVSEVLVSECPAGEHYCLIFFFVLTIAFEDFLFHLDLFGPG